MSVSVQCVWCEASFGSTIPGLCDELRCAIESAEEHESAILAFALELALNKDSWPYCSRRCRSEDLDHPELHPNRAGLFETLGGVGALPWETIREEAEQTPNVIPISTNEKAALRLLESREKAVYRRRNRPLGMLVFGLFFTGFFMGAMSVYMYVATEGEPILRVSGSTLIIGVLLGCIAALMSLRHR
jgi:hypothetical protein